MAFRAHPSPAHTQLRGLLHGRKTEKLWMLGMIAQRAHRPFGGARRSRCGGKIPREARYQGRSILHFCLGRGVGQDLHRGGARAVGESGLDGGDKTRMLGLGDIGEFAVRCASWG